MFSLIVTLMIVLPALTGCEGNSRMPVTMEPKNDPKLTVVLSDESQIRIVVYQHLIRHVIKAPTKRVLFISATDMESHALTSTFPNCKLRSAARAEITADRKVQDKTSKENGVILDMHWIKIDGEKARCVAGTLLVLELPSNLT